MVTTQTQKNQKKEKQYEEDSRVDLGYNILDSRDVICKVQRKICDCPAGHVNDEKQQEYEKDVFDEKHENEEAFEDHEDEKIFERDDDEETIEVHENEIFEERFD